MSTLREKRKKERRALRRRKTADWTVVLILCAIAVCCGGYLIYHHWSVKQRELEYERLRQEETLSAATEGHRRAGDRGEHRRNSDLL